ncbi:MAG: MFS transporter [Prolixibacteraceae bacterium]|nr:MFS transporter [Prolixibacteraceae bacterium]NLO03098.1 sugar MFS transporter [Bacteroidales bacterium]
MSLKKFLPVYLIFLSMGMVDAAGPMVSLARESFTLSITMAALLPFLGYLMFGLLSVPMGVIQDKKGKVFIINMGLLIMFTGLVIPVLSGMYGNMVVNTGSMGQFYVILLAVLLIGGGGAIMQVGGNPFIRDISEDGHYSKNLSRAQSFITIGSSLGFLLPTFMFNLFGLDWSIIFPVYAIIVLSAFLWLNLSKISEVRQVKTHHATVKSCLTLMKNGYVLAMVMGIFIYCGVEIAVASHVPILLTDKYMFSLEKASLLISWSLFYLPIFLGRFFGSSIMKFIAPPRLLVMTGILALAGVFVILFANTLFLVLAGVILVGFGFANIFPLIFSISIDNMPEYQNELSGLMVTMIVGGTFIPMIMGIVADNVNITFSFVVPMLCMCYIIFLGILNYKKINR